MESIHRYCCTHSVNSYHWNKRKVRKMASSAETRILKLGSFVYSERVVSGAHPLWKKKICRFNWCEATRRLCFSMFLFPSENKEIDSHSKCIYMTNESHKFMKSKGNFHEINFKWTTNIQSGLLRFYNCCAPSHTPSSCSAQLYCLFVKNSALCCLQFNINPSCPATTYPFAFYAICKRSFSTSGFRRTRHFHFISIFSPFFALFECIERIQQTTNQTEFTFYYKSNNSIVTFHSGYGIYFKCR